MKYLRYLKAALHCLIEELFGQRKGWDLTILGFLMSEIQTIAITIGFTMRDLD